MKFFDREWVEGKGGVFPRKIRNVFWGAGFASGNGEVGGEFSFFRGQADADQGGFDHISQLGQALVLLQGQPENPRATAGGKIAKPGDFQG
jgi:hypothetical protein